jgi:hypothetical protein
MMPKVTLLDYDKNCKEKEHGFLYGFYDYHFVRYLFFYSNESSD